MMLLCIHVASCAINDHRIHKHFCFGSLLLPLIIIFYLPVFSSGAVSLRMDTVSVLGSAESSTVSLQGVSLSAVKTLTENMESCCPASETPNPVLKLTTIALTYHITTHTLQVITSRSVDFFCIE